MNPSPLHPQLIKVVGVSAAGKSTLVRGLRALGYDARPVSQEHSGVATLWRQFGVARALIYLHVAAEQQPLRRPDVSWEPSAHDAEVERLADARAHADLTLDTTAMTAEQVRALAAAFLEHHRIRRSDGPLPPLPETGGHY